MFLGQHIIFHSNRFTGFPTTCGRPARTPPFITFCLMHLGALKQCFLLFWGPIIQKVTQALYSMSKKNNKKKTHDACSFSQQLFSFVRVNVFSLNLFLLLFKLFSKAAIF